MLSATRTIFSRTLTPSNSGLLPLASSSLWGSRSIQTDENGRELLTIFDTTLRDGEQSPGVTLSEEEKLLIARQLSRLGVNVCEAGFPIASEGDFRAVSRIASDIGPLLDGNRQDPMVICGLARARKPDILRCFEAVKLAPKHRIHTFLATSDIHLKYKLQISRADCLDQIGEQVAYAKSLCDDIEFSPEDAGRSDVDFLTDALAVAIEAGATTLNIPDTVGYNLPHKYAERLKYLIDNTKGSDKVTWSTHCHNDLGLATANALAGVLAGGRQVEATINGIGERAGNTSLEEVVMAIYVHQNEMPIYTTIDTTQITQTSQMVSRHTNMKCQPNKAIVGSNAFSHESGIHQDGVLKHQETYEIIRPEVVGLTGHDGMVLGKLSGRHAFRSRLVELGYTLTDEDIQEAFLQFKRMADTKKTITDADILAIVREVMKADPPHEHFKLAHVSTMSSSHKTTPSTATVVVGVDGEEHTAAAASTGPVNAVCAAIDSIIGDNFILEDYKIDSATGGPDAVGEVSLVISEKDDMSYPPKMFSGFGSDPDIIIASGKAYIAAINALHSSHQHALELQASKEGRAEGAAAV